MRCAEITEFLKIKKKEPDFEAEPFDSDTYSECMTIIKSEPEYYIKEEADIPSDEINNTDSDCDSLNKTCTNLDNRTCSIVIKRLSDSVLQKYLRNKIKIKETIERSDSFRSLNNENVENSETNNKQKEIIENIGEINVKKLKRNNPRITRSFTTTNKENVKNCDTNNKQNEIIEDNDEKKVKKRTRNADSRITKFFTSPNKENLVNSDMNNKQNEIIENNGEKKVKNRKRNDSRFTDFFTSPNKENLVNSDTNNKQNAIIEDNGEKKIKKKKLDLLKNSFYIFAGPPNTRLYISLCLKCNKKYPAKTTVFECYSCKKRLLYECKKCHKQLGSHCGIDLHVKRECVDEGYYYECFECGYKSPLRVYVRKHIKRVHPNLSVADNIKIVKSKEIHADVCDPIDECLKCGKKFGLLNKLIKHVQLCNGSKAETLEVKKDSKQLPSDYSAAKNMIIRYCSNCHKEAALSDVGSSDKKLCTKCHAVLAFKCLMCQKQYRSCKGVVTHINTNHIEKQELSCTKCDFKSVSLAYLVSHYKRMHNPIVYDCYRCSKKLKSRENLKRHLLICGQEPNLHCEHCSYKTVKRQYLQQHIFKVHHIEDRSVVCPKCNSIYKDELILKAHLSWCGKGAHVQCDHCSFKTKWKSNMQVHLYRHHMSRSKYECSKCKFQFQNSIRLRVKRHLAFCGVKRRVKCGFCPYKTSTNALLKSHMLKKHSTDRISTRNDNDSR